MKKYHKDDEFESNLRPLDVEMYRKIVTNAIVMHNYSFSFVEHEGNRNIHAFLNSDVKTLSMNTAKGNVLKIYKREKESQKCHRIYP